MLYLSMQSKRSSVPRTLAILTNFEEIGNIVINPVNTTPQVKTNNCLHICHSAHVTI